MIDLEFAAISSWPAQIQAVQDEQEDRNKADHTWQRSSGAGVSVSPTADD
jgi:hypothetical protein